jgi:ABC-type multidrug transport system ATPase subunit
VNRAGAAALRFAGVTKRWPGGAVGLDALTFSVPRGAVAGFVGPNGAGKTTTFSLLAGFLTADAGEIEVLGRPLADPWLRKGGLGLLPQDAELPLRHTPRELLAHLARLSGLRGSAVSASVERALADVALTDRADHRIATLSHGMRRRAAIATALVGDPPLIVLDEPTAGLDPMQARALREALLARRGSGTLILSSHNLDELERICDHVVMIDAGRCVAEGPLHEVTGRSARCLLGVDDVVAACRAIEATGRRAHAADLGVEATLRSDESTDVGTQAILRALLDAGVIVRSLQPGVSLEARFFESSLKA